MASGGGGKVNPKYKAFLVNSDTLADELDANGEGKTKLLRKMRANEWIEPGGDLSTDAIIALALHRVETEGDEIYNQFLGFLSQVASLKVIADNIRREEERERGSYLAMLYYTNKKPGSFKFHLFIIQHLEATVEEVEYVIEKDYSVNFKKGATASVEIDEVFQLCLPENAVSGWTMEHDNNQMMRRDVILKKKPPVPFQVSVKWTGLEGQRPEKLEYGLLIGNVPMKIESPDGCSECPEACGTISPNTSSPSYHKTSHPGAAERCGKMEAKGESVELDALNQNMTSINSIIKNNLRWFSNQFVNRKFLVRREIQAVLETGGITPEEQASKLMDRVYNLIELAENKRELFNKFVDIFKCHGGAASAELVKKLKESRDDEGLLLENNG